MRWTLLDCCAAAVTGQPGNASLAVQVVPAAMDFTFGPPQTVAGASQTHGAALHVTRSGAASAEPLNGTATVRARVADMRRLVAFEEEMPA